MWGSRPVNGVVFVPKVPGTVNPNSNWASVIVAWGSKRLKDVAGGLRAIPIVRDGTCHWVLFNLRSNYDVFFRVTLTEGSRRSKDINLPFILESP